MIGALYRPRPPLTFTSALDQRCPVCEAPWTMHAVNSFVPLEHETGRWADLVFNVACPKPEDVTGR
jgi:hypothetical protein